MRATTFAELSRSLSDNPKPTGRRVKIAEVRLLAPVEPWKIVAVGLNYGWAYGQGAAIDNR